MTEHNYEEYRALELGDVVHVSDDLGPGRGHWYIVTTNDIIGRKIEAFQINRNRSDYSDSSPISTRDTVHWSGNRPILKQNSFVKLERYIFPYNSIGDYCGYICENALRNIISESEKKLGR